MVSLKADLEIRISVQVVYLGDNPRKLWERSREEKAAMVYVNEQATAGGNELNHAAEF